MAVTLWSAVYDDGTTRRHWERVAAFVDGLESTLGRPALEPLGRAHRLFDDTLATYVLLRGYL